MFQVICIIYSTYHVSGPALKFPVIEVATILTVVEVEMWRGQQYYTFAEIDRQFTYDARLFAVLPSSGEDELTDEQEAEAAECDRQFAEIIHEAENAI